MRVNAAPCGAAASSARKDSPSGSSSLRIAVADIQASLLWAQHAACVRVHPTGKALSPARKVAQTRPRKPNFGARAGRVAIRDTTQRSIIGLRSYHFALRKIGSIQFSVISPIAGTCVARSVSSGKAP